MRIKNDSCNNLHFFRTHHMFVLIKNICTPTSDSNITLELTCKPYNSRVNKKGVNIISIIITKTGKQLALARFTILFAMTNSRGRAWTTQEPIIPLSTRTRTSLAGARVLLVRVVSACALAPTRLRPARERASDLNNSKREI